MERFKGTKDKWIYRVIETDTAMFPLIIKRTPEHDDGDENHLIVAVFNVNDRESKEHIANAQLISKAPEMLEMLLVCLKDYKNIIPQSPARDSRMDEIEQLIKEATEI